MPSNYDFIMNYRKEAVYDVYAQICSDIKHYDRITRKQMVQAIYAVYQAKPDLFLNLMLTEEWEELGRFLKKRKRDIFNLSNVGFHFLIVHDLIHLSMADEIKPLYQKIVLDEEKRKKDEYIRFFIGLARIHGLIDLPDAYAIFHRFFQDISFETFKTLPSQLPRIFTDIEFYDFDVYDLIRHKDCFIEYDDIENDQRKHVYSQADYVSVSKYWLNLEDPQLKKMYDVLEKKGSPSVIQHALERTWIEMANNLILSEYAILKYLIDGLDNEEEAVELFNYYMMRLPKYRFQGEPANEITHDFKPIERKVYQTYDPCPCGSGIKYKFCCLNRKKLLENEAILTRVDNDVIYFLIDDIIFFANQKIGMFDTDIERDTFIETLSPEDFRKIKTHVFEHMELIDQYIIEHFEDYPSEVLDTLGHFKRAKTGHFVAIEYRDQKLVVLSSDEEHAYMLTGLSTPLAELLSVDRLPVFIDITLIPFKNRIIYPIDFSEIPIPLGPNIRKRLDEIMKNVAIETTF